MRLLFPPRHSLALGESRGLADCYCCCHCSMRKVADVMKSKSSKWSHKSQDELKVLENRHPWELVMSWQGGIQEMITEGADLNWQCTHMNRHAGNHRENKHDSSVCWLLPRTAAGCTGHHWFRHFSKSCDFTSVNNNFLPVFMIMCIVIVFKRVLFEIVKWLVGNVSTWKNGVGHSCGSTWCWRLHVINLYKNISTPP